MAALGFASVTSILAVGAHPDDIELGCGGTLARFQASGARVYAVAFSQCSDETPEDPNTRVREFQQSSRALAIEPAEVHDYPNRELSTHSVAIMADLESLQIRLAPDIVFIPFVEDPHQDHEAVAKASVRVFRRKETILQYEILRYGSNTFTPTLFVNITDTLSRKVLALRQYESQFHTRAYFDEESFRSLARTRGAQSGYPYAEGFVVYKLYW